MKKFLAVLTMLAMLAMVFSLAACSGGQDPAPAPVTQPEGSGEQQDPGPETAPVPAGETKVLGVVMPNATHGFTGESIRHAEAACKDMSAATGYNYRFLTSSESSEQNNQLDTLINENVDCIVMWPHNGDELRAGAQKVLDAGIPLIIYDRLITDMPVTAEVMGDNETIGEMTGEYFNRYFSDELAAGTVNILEFKGDNSTVPQQRSDGFSRTADENFNIVQQFSTDWQRSVAMEQMETFLNNNSREEVESIKAVFTHDDEVLFGVLDAITKYNGDADLDIRLLSGVGGMQENVDTFGPIKEEHNIDQVTYLFSPAMVREAIEYGVDVLDGKDVSGLILIDTMEIDLASLDAYKASEPYILRYERGI